MDEYLHRGLDLLGYQVHVEHDAFEFVHPEDREVAIEAAKKTFEEGEIQRREEYRVVTVDGDVINTLTSTGLLFDDSGKPFATVNVIRDITERKKAEERLKKAKDRAQEYLNIADVIIVVIDRNHEVIEINEKGCEVLGYDKDEIIGKNWYENFVPERVRKDVLKDATKPLMNGRVEGGKRYENPILTKDGEERIISWKNSVIRDDDGEIIGTLSSGRDITERKKAEEKYTFESNLLNSLLDNADDLVYFKDREGRYLRASKAYADALGLDREDVEGKTAFELYPEDQAKQMHEDDLKVMEKGVKVVDREQEVTLSDGANRWFSTTKVPRYDDEGNVIGMIGISRDITERKRAEEKEELLHSLLRHDLRNKSQILQGYLRLLGDLDLPQEARDHIDKIMEVSHKEMDIIDKVSTLSKAYEEETQEVDITSIVNEGLERWRPQSEDGGMEIVHEGPEGECMVKGGLLLGNVFANIIENSIQHSGGTKIRISGTVEDKEVVYTIEDDGRGIPDEDKRKVFHRNFTTDKERGTGLGMFLVKKLLERYGGSIEVKDSELGGARFDIHLKRV